MTVGEGSSLEYYILVKTATYARAVLRILTGAGIKARQVKSPRELSRGGCAYAVAARSADAGTLLRVTAEAGLARFRVYVTADGKTFSQLR